MATPTAMTGASSLPSLVLSLARFSNPSLKSAASKVIASAGAEAQTQEDKDRGDGLLLASLLIEPATRADGVRLLRETMTSGLNFDFKPNGSILGFWSRGDNESFCRMAVRHGVLGALMGAIEGALGGACVLPPERVVGALQCTCALIALLGEAAPADQEAAAAGLSMCPVAALALAIEASLADRTSDLWSSEAATVLALRLAGSLSSFVRIALKGRILLPQTAAAAAAGLSAAPAGTPSESSSAAAAASYGPYLPALEALNASAALHGAIATLLRSPSPTVLSPLSNAISSLVNGPGVFSGNIGAPALRTARLLLETAMETVASSASFPVLRDPALVLAEPYRTERADEFTLWAQNSIVGACITAAVSLLDAVPGAARPVLLGGNLLPSLVLQLLSGPHGRDCHAAGVALALFCGQDPQVRAALTANGALAAAYAALRRYRIGRVGSWAWFLLTLPRLLSWAKEGVLTSAEEPTGLGHPFAVATLYSVAATSSYVAQLRALPSMYRSFESALLDVAALTSDRVMYQLACSGLNYLDVAPPPFAKARLRASGRPAGRLQRSPLHWTVDDVFAWASRQSFAAVAPALLAGCVDGPTLLSLSDEDLEEAGLGLALHRAVAADAIAHLRDVHGVRPASSSSSFARGSASAGGVAGDGSGGAEVWVQGSPVSSQRQAPSSAGGGVGGAGFVRSDSAGSVGGAGAAATPPFAIHSPLSSAGGGGASRGGVDSSSAPSSAALAMAGDAAAAASSPTKPRFDVFISYRRSTGSHLARLIVVYLQLAGFSPFLDVEGLAEGAFDRALEGMLASVSHVVVLLTEGALDRCINDTDNKDFVRKEIATALRLKKNVVPVHCNFSFPRAEELPVDMRGLLTQNMVEWHHTYTDAAVAKVVKFLRGQHQGQQAVA